jgi:hypothetical protein
MNQFWGWINKWLPGTESVFMFGLAAVCRSIWKSKNKACFKKIMIKNPIEILCMPYANMKYWAGLFKTEFQEQLAVGMSAILATTYKALAAQNKSNSTVLHIEDVTKDEDEEAPRV